MEITELTSSLRIVISMLHKSLRKQISSSDRYSLTELETIMHLVHKEFLSPTELAGLARVKTQSMSQILKKLEEQGIIKRTPAENDKRMSFISLTTFGREIVAKIKASKDEWLKSIIVTRLTDDDRELLAKALPVLNKLIKVQ